MLARRSTIIVMAILVFVAITALGAAADEELDDWTVLSNEQRTGEVITVNGQLNIGLVGKLHLRSCTLRFTDGSPDDIRVHIRSGTLVLEGSTLVMENGGHMMVEGRMEVRGTSHIKYADILIASRGVLVVKNSALTLEGIYYTPDTNDPLELKIEGTATFTNSDVDLVYAFVSSVGKFTFTDSSIDATRDWEQEYEGLRERLRFDQGTVTLVDSTFSELFHGIQSRADLTVEGCLFNASDLRLFVPWWFQGLETELDTCTFTASDLMVDVQYKGDETKDLDLLFTHITILGGVVLLDINETYAGDIALVDVSVSDYSGYGIIVRARGVYGSLRLESISLDGPRGIQVKDDFSGLEIINSTIRAQRTALDFTGTASPIPATLDNVTLWGEDGIVARNTVLKVTASDLSGADVPLRGEGGSFTTLVDCTLEEADIQLSVAPGGRNAGVNVDRHLTIDSVEWTIEQTIDEGVVWFHIFSENITYPLPPKPWPIGSPVKPLIRILEWSLDDQGEGDYLAFTEVEPKIVLDAHTFEAVEYLNPWDDGPFTLVFHDDVNPWAQVDPGVNLLVTEPSITLWGTCGDVGTGISEMRWTLSSSLGEEVSSGQVDHLVNGKWRTTIELTGNVQIITLFPYDLSSNYDQIPIRPIVVDVPDPLLTIVRPETGTLTNITLVTVAGSADWYANMVEIMVVGYPDVYRVPVVSGHFSRVVTLPEEGQNQLLITSYDPFGGTDTKLISVHVDTIAPELWFQTLDDGAVNYVNNPSLVIVGTTDDHAALITVNRQEVGLLGDNTFATTVHLGEGPQVIRVEAEDAAGNLNRIDLEVTLDTIVPQLTLVNPSSNPFWSNKERVTVEIEVGEVVIGSTLNGKDVEVIEGVITRTITLGDGRTGVDVTVTDRAGNVATMLVYLFLDDEVPVLKIHKPRQGAIVNATAVPVVIITDEVGCTISATGAIIDVTEVSNARLVGTMYLPPGEGVRHVSLVITDRAGNTRTKVLDIDVDTVKPFISLSDISRGEKVTTEPLHIKGLTEAGAKVVWVNGEMATLAPDGEFTTTIQLKEGDRTITVEVLDRANNYNKVAVEVKVLGVPEFHVPVAGWAAITILFAMGALVATTEIGRYTALVLFLPLYTKLRKEKILDQRTRGLIQGYITANPGANYTIIRDNLSLADGTLTYHLQVLEREGYVYSIREGLFRCFYPQGVPPPKRGKLHLSDTQSDIVRIVKRIPGITVGEIATAMKRRPNVISYHLKLLREGGLIRMEEDGRHVRVYPIDTAVAMI